MTNQASERTAKLLVGGISAVVLGLVVALYTVTKIEVDLGFDISIFPKFHAALNSIVSVLLIIALYQIKQRNMAGHKRSMMGAFVVSGIFLLSYVFYHSISEPTSYGGEGLLKYIYYFVLITHIILAGGILPFILLTFYRAWTSNFEKHKNIAKWTWPLWLYVAISGVAVYFLIAPYY